MLNIFGQFHHLFQTNVKRVDFIKKTKVKNLIKLQKFYKKQQYIIGGDNTELLYNTRHALA